MSRAERAYPARVIETAERPLLERTARDGLMKRAAFAVALTVRRKMRERGLPRDAGVLLLVGGGNNGGDALYAGATLSRWGWKVTAVLLSERAHPRALAAAQSAGVRWVRDGEEDARRHAESPVWVDGITGLGVRFPLRPTLAAAIDRWEGLRTQRAPLVIAVDLPSAVDVDSGAVPDVVLRADLTVTMGALKPALLLPPAAVAAGDIEVVDLGLDLPPAAARVRRLTQDECAALLPRPHVADHKYRRGVVGMVTGSARYPGAGVLTVAGALGAGVGMVRYLGPPKNQELVLHAHPEVVPSHGRCQAWVLGSGVDPADEARAEEVTQALEAAHAESLPVVLDAGALHLAPARLPATTVLTPHAGELAAVLTARGVPRSRTEIEAHPARAVRETADLTGATVLLKGAITLVGAPGIELYAVRAGTPWLASAGTGDVLAGVLGALLAGHTAGGALTARRVAQIVAAGAAIHGWAGRRASAGGPLTASGVAAAVPRIIAQLIARHATSVAPHPQPPVAHS